MSGCRAHRLRASLALAAALPVMPVGAQSPASIVADALLGARTLGPAALSPKGDQVAITLQDVAAGAAPVGGAPSARSSLWLATVAGPGQRLISDTIAYQGVSHAVWSADGERLAAVLTSREGVSRIGIWERESGRWTLPVEAGIDFGINFRASGGHPPLPIRWLHRHRLLLGLPAQGPELPDSACAGMRRTRWGCARVSVLTSADTVPPRPRRRLVVVDVGSARGRPPSQRDRIAVLAEGDIRYAFVSPDESHAALVIAEPVEAPRRRETQTGRLYVVRLTPGASLRPVRGFHIPDSDAAPMVRWAPDTSALLALAVPDSGQRQREALLVSLNGTVVRRSGPGQSVRSIAWLGRQPLGLVTTSGGAYAGVPRWRHLLGAGVGDVAVDTTSGNPPFLMPVRGGSISIVRDKVVLFTDSGRAIGLTEAPGLAATRIAWPAPYADPTASMVLVHGRDGHLYRVNLATRSVDRVLPASEALAAFSPAAGVLVSVTNEEQATALRARSGGSMRTLFRVGGVGAGARVGRRLIRFASPRGDTLTALVLMPPDAPRNRPLPLIVSVYSGQHVDGLFPPGSLETDWPATSLLPYAASSYAVLIPSLPREESGDANSCVETPRLVDAAVDAAVRAGVADSTRLAVHGHSYGGYDVYCIVRSSSRFRAGVVLSGAADLGSLYSAFPPNSWTTPAPHRNRFLESFFESGQLRIGVSPWEAPMRYVAGSPYYAAAAIRTPLLIIHGEHDYVPVQQAERMFKALTGLGRHAELLRYRGEGHVIHRKENVAHLHRHLARFLERFVLGGVGGG